MKQISTNKNTSREVILTESRTMRKEYVKEQYFDILDKIKAIPYMTKDMVVSVEQVANYYEVSNEAIRTVIKRNREEIEEDGYTVLKGEELKEFKNKICEFQGEDSKIISNKTTVLSIMSKKAVILIGFYLQNNKISETLKRELLNENPKLYKYFESIAYSTNYIKRYENEFEIVIEKLLGKYNKIEKQVKFDKYHIDFVINDYVAIEIDENGHANYNKNKENERENIINNNYKLFRYNPEKDDLLNFIGEIIQELN